MDQYSYLEQIEKEFLGILFKYLPRHWIKRGGYSAANFYAALSDDTMTFVESKYIYTGPKKFVHWTSVNNLLSMINYREIRMYNVLNSSDETEFSYPAETLLIPNDQIEHSKNYLYTFSFCENSELNNEYLWKSYGKDYSGVAVEFEIENDPQDWKKFMLSKVYYGLPDEYVQMKNELVEAMKKYPQATTKIDLGKLISFYKQVKFEMEKEVRLSVYFPFNDTKYHDIHCNKEFRMDANRPRITEYYKLPLWVNNESAAIKNDLKELDNRQNVDPRFFESAPKIKISQVHFGKNCGINNYQFQNFHKELKDIIWNKLGYPVNLSMNLFSNNNKSIVLQ